MKIEILENNPRTSRTFPPELGQRKYSEKTPLHLRQGRGKIYKALLGGEGKSSDGHDHDRADYGGHARS